MGGFPFSSVPLSFLAASTPVALRGVRRRQPRWAALSLRAVTALAWPGRAVRRGRGRGRGRSAKADWKTGGRTAALRHSLPSRSLAFLPGGGGVRLRPAPPGAPPGPAGCEGARRPPPAPGSGVFPALGRRWLLKRNMASPGVPVPGPERLSRPFCRCA